MFAFAFAFAVTCDQAFFFFFSKGGRGERKKKITPSSCERHKGIIGRGHDLRLRLLMILVPASDCLQHKFGANRLKGRNLNVRTVEVQLDSEAGTKLPGIKID